MGATLPQVLYSGDASTDPYYRNGRIRAEHGNALALFCSPDPLRPQNLPLGYFISRLAATADRDTGSHTPGLHTIWRELVISVKGNRLALEVIDAIANKAKVKPEDTINMPDDIWGGYSPTLREIKERYSDLYGESVMRRGESKTTIALLSEVGELQPLAVSYMEKGVTDIVVMGHTHVACSNQNLPFAHQSSVYLNSGAWCNGIGKATFVEIDKTDTSLICTVMNGASFKPSFPSITINIC